MDKHMLGLLLMGLGVADVILISLIGVIKHKPILILAGIVAGVITGGLGVAFYLGKIPLGG